jgi:hypothetical protein
MARDDAAPRPLPEMPMIVTVLLIVLILALIGGLPTWGYSSSWGYGPSGGIGVILAIVLICWLLGVF